MKVKAIKTRIFQPAEDLVDFIIEHIAKLEEGSVLVVTSKIAALSENRIVSIRSDDEKEEVIKKESDIAVHHPYGWLSIKDGLMVGSAGLDASNADGDYYIMLPKDSFKTAHIIRQSLKEHYQLKELGVIVTDSRMMPLRKGTLGAAFGYAGIKALRSYVGKKDLFGRKFERQTSNIPDALATAAVLVMGEGAEQQPLAVITDLNIDFTDKRADHAELQVSADEDIYGYFFRNL